MMREIVEKGHYYVKNPPIDVEECWFYTGKQSSIHIRIKPINTEININGKLYKVTIPVPQVNIDLPSIRKVKDVK